MSHLPSLSLLHSGCAVWCRTPALPSLKVLRPQLLGGGLTADVSQASACPTAVLGRREPPGPGLKASDRRTWAPEAGPQDNSEGRESSRAPSRSARAADGGQLHCPSGSPGSLPLSDAPRALLFEHSAGSSRHRRFCFSRNPTHKM